MNRRTFLGFVGTFLFAPVVLSGCSGTSGKTGDASTLDIDLSDYSDMKNGSVLIVMPDGTKDATYAIGGVSDMMEYAEANEVTFDDKYKDAIFVIVTKVDEVAKDYQTRSGKKFAASLNLTNSTGKVYGGHKALTYLSVETDEQTVLDEGIEAGDIVQVAVKDLDVQYGCAYAPTKVKKFE